MEKIKEYWVRLKKHPLAYNLVLIAGIFVAMALVAHVVMQIGTRHGSRCTVPDLAGISLAEAQEIARKNDLVLFINDSLFVPAYEGGIILDQLPEKGVEVKPGRTVYITINSFKQKMVDVPYVAERSLRQAKNMLEIGGLEIGELIYRDDIATNYVLAEYYDGKPIRSTSKVQAEIGSGVTLYVGVAAGHGTAIIPQLIGLPLKEAKSRLWEQGLNVGKISFDPGITLLNQREARVYIQGVDPERSVVLGTKVDLRLTLDAEQVKASRSASEKLAKEILEIRKQEADSTEIDIMQTEAISETTEERNTGEFFDE